MTNNLATTNPAYLSVSILRTAKRFIFGTETALGLNNTSKQRLETRVEQSQVTFPIYGPGFQEGIEFNT